MGGASETGLREPRGSVARAVELSFVLPCLNERETVVACVQAARAFLETHGVVGEVVVADNGSTDGSDSLAFNAGARIVRVAERGYGAAIAGGVARARGRYVIVADADLSYDLGESGPFLERLREGTPMVVGTRLRGEIRHGAMPRLNRWVGNPVLSALARLAFRCPVSDFHCGMRGFRQDIMPGLGLRTTGMEFATEMIVKAHLRGHRIAEVPITLHPDGRSGGPHLRPWRDGWRHLRFMMLYAPVWTLVLPGLACLLLGLVLGVAVATVGVRVGSVALGPHTLVGASLLVLVGYQGVTIGMAARIFAFEERLGPGSRFLPALFRHLTLERGMLAGALVLLAGVACIGVVAARWAQSGFGELPLRTTIVQMIAGATLVALAMQTVLVSIFYSMLGIPRRQAPVS